MREFYDKFYNWWLKNAEIKGILQLFELGSETRLIRSAVINWRPRKFLNLFLMIQSHERSINPF
jgi:hypothetical protein